MKRLQWILAATLALCGSVFAAEMFDVNTPGISYTGTGSAAYEAGAIPDDGSTPNCIDFNSSGSATATLNLVAGQKYRITANRRVTNTWNLAYYTSVNGTQLIYDNALALDNTENSFQQFTYYGYFTAPTASNVVSVHDGGSFYTRLNYLSFEATTDVFFDRYTSDLGMTGTAGYTPIQGAITNGVTNNGIGFGPSDTVTGTAELISGATYNVYSCRAIHDSGNFAYDVTLDGVFFAHDSALPDTVIYANDWASEKLLGEYTATDSATSVLLSNGGAYAARFDYLRFELVNIPEPATFCLLAFGALGFIRRRR